MSSLGEAFPQEQARVRELLVTYRSLGTAGVFGAAMLEDTLKRADQAAMSGDVVQMLQMYQELQGCK